MTSTARGRAGLPRLHVVTDDEILMRTGWLHATTEVLTAGGDRLALHVRGPGLPGRVIYERVEAVLETAAEVGAMLLVNDRVDVALTLKTSGVQLGERSIPVREARALLGESAWIGASVHGPERAADAERDGADYLVVGTLFATPSHPDRPGEGAGLLERVGRASGLPLVAIGGVTPQRVHVARQAGAHGVAVRGGVWDSADSARAVTDYLRSLEP